MKKIIMGTLIATFLVGNSTLAFAANVENPSVDNTNFSQKQEDRNTEAIPSFYYDIVEHTEYTTVSRDKLTEISRDFRKSGKQKETAMNLAGTIVASGLKLSGFGIPGAIAVGALRTAAVNNIRSNTEAIQDKIEAKLARNTSSSISCSLTYRIKIKHYSYGAYPSEVDSVECIGIDF